LYAPAVTKKDVGTECFRSVSRWSRLSKCWPHALLRYSRSDFFLVYLHRWQTMATYGVYVYSCC